MTAHEHIHLRAVLPRFKLPFNLLNVLIYTVLSIRSISQLHLDSLIIPQSLFPNATYRPSISSQFFNP